MIDLDLQKIYNRIRLPELYWESRFSMIPDKPYKERVLEWDHDHIKDRLREGKGLYLYGTYGHGKSAIAALILKSAAAKAILGLWINFRDLTEAKIDKTSFDDFETLRERAFSVPLLVVDEFEVCLPDWYNVKLLDNLVRTRHQDKKITIITSNHSPKDLLFPNNKELANLSGSFLGVFPEVFNMVHVNGKNFRKEKIIDR